jgi:ribosomal protein L37AE/L43A
MDFSKEVDIGISRITRDLKIKDAIRGKLNCPKCKSKLRHTIYGDFLCPKCLKIIK